MESVHEGKTLSSPFWKKQVFLDVVIGCGLFVVLTVAAMFLYPGGLFTGEITSGYHFFCNFFSDLGRITVEGGKANTASALLFFLALSIAGLGLIIQATGQKIIVYVSIVSVMAQSWLAYQVRKN